MSEDKKISDLIVRSENAMRLRDFESAERYARKLLIAEPTSQAARMILGTVYLRTNKATDALAAFSSIVETDAKNVRALEGMAIVYLKLGRPMDALSALEHAIDYKPTDAELLYNLGNTHKALGNLRAAEMSYAKAVEIDPSHVIAYKGFPSTPIIRRFTIT